MAAAAAAAAEGVSTRTAAERETGGGAVRLQIGREGAEA